VIYWREFANILYQDAAQTSNEVGYNILATTVGESDRSIITSPDPDSTLSGRALVSLSSLRLPTNNAEIQLYNGDGVHPISKATFETRDFKKMALAWKERVSTKLPSIIKARRTQLRKSCEQIGACRVSWRERGLQFWRFLKFEANQKKFFKNLEVLDHMKLLPRPLVLTLVSYDYHGASGDLIDRHIGLVAALTTCERVRLRTPSQPRTT
jgi:hypothetical protein